MENNMLKSKEDEPLWEALLWNMTGTCARGSVRAHLHSIAASPVITIVMEEHPHAISPSLQAGLASGPGVHGFSAQGLTRLKPW